MDRVRVGGRGQGQCLGSQWYVGRQKDRNGLESTREDEDHSLPYCLGSCLRACRRPGAGPPCDDEDGDEKAEKDVTKPHVGGGDGSESGQPKVRASGAPDSLVTAPSYPLNRDSLTMHQCRILEGEEGLQAPKAKAPDHLDHHRT